MSLEMSVQDWLLVAISVVAMVLLFAWVVPNVVTYTESVSIAAPVADVYAALRRPEAIAKWSAWPEATGTECRCDAVELGRLSFLRRGRPALSQTIVEAEENKKIILTLSDFSGFGQRQSATFFLLSRPATKGDKVETIVDLHFHSTAPRPLHLVIKSAGLAEWVHDLHRKDLDRLKRFCEEGGEDDETRRSSSSQKEKEKKKTK